MTIQTKKVESVAQLSSLKEQYIEQATAPLDGMWLCGFVPMANHFGCYSEDELVGFYCVDDGGYLLQFFVNQRHQSQSSQLFESILRCDHSSSDQIKGAFVSTAEPYYLSLCLDQFSKFEVNALMYQLDESSRTMSQANALDLTMLDLSQLPDAIAFTVETIGDNAGWLKGYYTNLINRQELFGVWKDGRLIATGESRGYDEYQTEYQTEYADVGMIVAKSERGRGTGAQILRQLVARNEARGLKSICSTEKKNLAAQRAIERAGFFASNRILHFVS